MIHESSFSANLWHSIYCYVGIKIIQERAIFCCDVDLRFPVRIIIVLIYTYICIIFRSYEGANDARRLSQNEHNES